MSHVPTLTHFNRPPPSVILDQLVEMTGENLTSLGTRAVPVSNELFPLYQATLAIEVGQYLVSMGYSPERCSEVIVATEPSKPSQVIGYLLYQPLAGVADACGVSYMIVRASNRRQGIGRLMIQEMLARYPHAELSCFVEKVPVYEAMGFQVIGYRETQVRMNTRDHSADGVMAVLNVAEIYQMPQVLAIHQGLLQKHGRKALVNAEKKIERQVEQIKRKVVAFVNERMAIATSTE